MSSLDTGLTPQLKAERDGRILGADGVRALATLWVFTAHIRFLLQPPSGNGPFIFDFVSRGELGVPIFFVLSGMLLSRPFWKAYLADRPMPDLKDYAIRRLVRIVPAYLVCLSITYLLLFGLSGDRLVPVAISALFLNSWHWKTFFPFMGNSPLWSIGVEMMFYVFLPLFMLIVFLLRQRLPGIVLCLIGIGCIISFQLIFARNVEIVPAGAISAEDVECYKVGARWFPNRHPVAVFAHFLFGCISARIILHFELNSQRRPRGDATVSSVRWNRYDSLSLVAIGLLLVESMPLILSELPGLWRIAHLIVSMRSQVIHYDFPLFPILVMVLLTLLTQTHSLGRWLDNRFLCYTAQVSYGFYLWHYPIIGWTLKIWPGAKEGDTGQVLMVVLVATAASFAVATISYHIVERPVIQWAQRLRRPAIDRNQVATCQ